MNMNEQLNEMDKMSQRILATLKELKIKIDGLLSKQEVEIIKTIKEFLSTLSKQKLTNKQTDDLNSRFRVAKLTRDHKELEKIKEESENLIIQIKNNLLEDIRIIMISIETSILKIQDEEHKTLLNNEKKEIQEKYKEEESDSLDQKLEKLKNLKNHLEEMNISRFGKIKVFIKIKPNSSDKINIEDESSKIINGFLRINNDKTIVIDDDKFGPFSKISFKLDGEKNIVKNKDLCDEIFEESQLNIDNLLGRSTILFEYGISGSGKSWSFFGGKDDVGLIQLLLINWKSKPNVQVAPFKIFEHYLDETSNFINSDNSVTPTFLENQMKSRIRNFEIENYLNDDEGIDFLKLNKERTRLLSIKKTPNNDKSSRTHLFIIYKITTRGRATDGYITFIDSAGKEEPLEITKQFYTKTIGEENEIENPSLPFISRNINFKDASFKRFNFKNFSNKYLNDEEKRNIYSSNIDSVKNIIREGFFINESFAHMIYYFSGGNIKKMNFVKKTVSSYKSYNKKGQLNVFYDPPSSRKIVKINELQEINRDDPILITTIFEYLTNLCTEKETKKFRFIMIGNIRTEKEYKIETKNTLKFVDLFKSN